MELRNSEALKWRFERGRSAIARAKRSEEMGTAVEDIVGFVS